MRSILSLGEVCENQKAYDILAGLESDPNETPHIPQDLFLPKASPSTCHVESIQRYAESVLVQLQQTQTVLCILSSPSAAKHQLSHHQCSTYYSKIHTPANAMMPGGLAGDCTTSEGISVHVGTGPGHPRGRGTARQDRGAGHRIHRWHAAAASGGGAQH